MYVSSQSSTLLSLVYLNIYIFVYLCLKNGNINKIRKYGLVNGKSVVYHVYSCQWLRSIVDRYILEARFDAMSSSQ